MAKNKPKETIEYVIRLQDKERQLLEDMLIARNFNQVASPIVDALKDVSFWITLASLLGILGISVTPPSGSRAKEIDSWSEAIFDGVARARKEGGDGDLVGVGKVLWEYFTLPGFAYQAGRVYG